MAVAGTWTNPTEEDLGATYTWTKTVDGTPTSSGATTTGVTYTVTARSNGKRITSVTIAATATQTDTKTGKASSSTIKSFFADTFLPMLNSNMGDASSKVF